MDLGVVRVIRKVFFQPFFTGHFRYYLLHTLGLLRFGGWVDCAFGFEGLWI